MTNIPKLKDSDLRTTHGLILRVITDDDIKEIVKLERKYFNKDDLGNREKYEDILNKSSDYDCLVLIDGASNKFVGYVRYSLTDNNRLINKYSKAVNVLKPIEGLILYISTLVVVEEFSRKGIASSLMNYLLEEGKNNGAEEAICFVVKNNIENKVNAKHLVESFDFKFIEEIEDLWNQSKYDVDLCPVCEGKSHTCVCTGLVYLKEI